MSHRNVIKYKYIILIEQIIYSLRQIQFLESLPENFMLKLDVFVRVNKNLTQARGFYFLCLKGMSIKLVARVAIAHQIHP